MVTVGYKGLRSSHGCCSVKKGIVRNFANFTGKHLCQSLFFNKVAGLTPATLLKKSLKAFNFIKKETLAQVLSFEFCKISKNSFSIEHLRTTASLFLLKHLIYEKNGFLYAFLLYSQTR